MKGALSAIVLAAALTIPVAANAQDWVMDWNSTGFVATAPFSWSITDSSPTSLRPAQGSLPPFFSGQAFNLGFTWQGRPYGGEVGTGSFQSTDWAVPAPCNSALNCRFHADFAGGTFNFTDANHFALDVNVGIGHNHAHLVGVGHRDGVTASAAEPAVLLLSGVGLVGAAMLRRSRRSS